MARAPVDEVPKPVAIVLSVRLTDGSFESNTSIPVSASHAERMAAAARWMEIMQFGLKLSGDVLIKTSDEPQAQP